MQYQISYLCKGEIMKLKMIVLSFIVLSSALSLRAMKSPFQDIEWARKNPEFKVLDSLNLPQRNATLLVVKHPESLVVDVVTADTQTGETIVQHETRFLLSTLFKDTPIEEIKASLQPLDRNGFKLRLYDPRTGKEKNVGIELHPDKKFTFFNM